MSSAITMEDSPSTPQINMDMLKSNQTRVPKPVSVLFAPTSKHQETHLCREHHSEIQV